MKYIKKRLFLLCLAPSAAGFFIFYIIPFFYSFYYAFTGNAFTKKFVWFDNFIIIIQNESFQNAMKNTIKFTVGAADNGYFVCHGTAHRTFRGENSVCKKGVFPAVCATVGGDRGVLADLFQRSRAFYVAARLFFMEIFRYKHNVVYGGDQPSALRVIRIGRARRRGQTQTVCEYRAAVDFTHIVFCRHSFDGKFV